MNKLGAALGFFAVLAIGAGALVWPRESAPEELPTTVTMGAHPVAVDLSTMARGGSIRFDGALVSSFDGTTFDAAGRTDRAGGSVVDRSGGLFEIEGAGLRVASRDPATHHVELVASGLDAPACAAAHVAAPCLVPRTTALAHERLLTEAEFEASLTGNVTVAVPRAPAFVDDDGLTTEPSFALFGVAALALAGAAAAVARARSRTKLAGVKRAAKEARAAIAKERSLSELSHKIDHMVARAEDLARLSKEAAARLAKIDRPGLERKRASYTHLAEADAREVRAWVEREIGEANRLANDVATAEAGIDRIAAALRVIPLEVREGRGVQLRVADDPVDATASELALHEEARAEADAWSEESNAAQKRAAP